jgi:hypothetical protein
VWKLKIVLKKCHNIKSKFTLKLHIYIYMLHMLHKDI